MRAYIQKVKIPDVKCYIGEREELVQPTFFHVTSFEGGGGLRWIFLTLLESGHVYTWEKEFYKMVVYKRVQDQPNIMDLSFSKLPEEMVPWKPQRITDGKFKQIFVLWSACFLVSASILAVENIRHYYHVLSLSKVVKLPKLL